MATDEIAHETLVRVEEFDEVAQEWDELVRAMRKPTPFLLHGWVKAWLCHYADDAEPAIHVARRGSRLVAALPFVMRRRWGLRIASFVGDEYPFVDVLLASDETLETARALVSYAGKSHDCASLGMISTESAIIEACGTRLRLVPRVGAPVLDISDGFEQVYSEKYSKKTRREHARRQRKLAKLGKIEIDIARTPEEIEVALEDAYRLHALRWKGRFDLSTFGTEQGTRFHRDALRGLAESGAAQLQTLRLDGRAIAFRCNLMLGQRMFFYRSAFDPAYYGSTPGVLSALAAIEQAASEGFTAIEFLGGTQTYKLELADRVEQLYIGFGLAGGARGTLYSGMGAARLALLSRLKRSRTLYNFYVKRVGPHLLRLHRHS
jgi:CelD/BcsL family acetyltransferase involved in cellulose biosynthesis